MGPHSSAETQPIHPAAFRAIKTQTFTKASKIRPLLLLRCHLLVVQLLSHVRLFATPQTATHQVSLSILHHLPEFAQTHVHRVSDAIQPSHPLSSPFSSCLQWVSSSLQMAKVLELQHQSFQWIGNGKPLLYSCLENHMNSMKRRHIDYQKAHEKMRNIANYYRHANQNYNKISSHTVRVTIIKKSTNNKYWSGCREREHSDTAGSNVSWWGHYGEQWGDFLEN